MGCQANCVLVIACHMSFAIVAIAIEREFVQLWQRRPLQPPFVVVFELDCLALVNDSS
jgi:hypothetical protein